MRIESLLSARLFLVPQICGDQIYFISNLNGRNSLYVMAKSGGIPQPLLPPDLALQNPHLMEGRSFVVFPELGKILVMIDRDGDENYRPMVIPLAGGYPEPFAGEQFAGHSVMAFEPNLQGSTVYLLAQSRSEALFRSYLAHVGDGRLEQISEGRYGRYPIGRSPAHDKYILVDQFGVGDHVLYLRDQTAGTTELLYGVPLSERIAGEPQPPNGIGSCYFVRDGTAVLCTTMLFDDRYGLGLLPLDEGANPEIVPVPITGQKHTGSGELEELAHLTGRRFLVRYNIDGCSWAYEAEFDEATPEMRLVRVLVGQGKLAGGVLESLIYDGAGDRYALSFSTAVSPTQIFTLDDGKRGKLQQHTDERLLGLPTSWLSPGEDASFDSYDGLRISARLYLPSPELDFEGPRPLIYYVHGGPQSQERPDFAWFSMPFIQFLTLNGFAVFVPNVRGSTGYGFEYMSRVVRDWGGQDRLDHVHAMTEVLPRDKRLDVGRAGVVGRSYGGYMTLMLAGRHPELWRAAVDMFGPYDLLTFADRVPETWKPFIKMTVGDPETEADFLRERSPKSYLDRLACPLLVVQGQNDPRVVEKESSELVEDLRAQGKMVDYLLFPNEGHDVIKFENRVKVYNAMTDFFKKQLMADS